MMRAALRWAVIDEQGRVRREGHMPSRSFVQGFVAALYSQFSGLSYAVPGGIPEPSTSRNGPLIMTAGGAEQQAGGFYGGAFGIVVGRGTSPVSAGQTGLTDGFGPRHPVLALRLPLTSTFMIGLAYDGTSLLAVNAYGSHNRIQRHDPTTGALVSYFSAPGSGPRGLAWDGAYLWNGDRIANRIYKLDPTTGAVISSFPSPVVEPYGLAWDGTSLWCSSQTADQIVKIDPGTGQAIASFSFPDPGGLSWDGTHLLVGVRNGIVTMDPTSGAIVSSSFFDPSIIGGIAIVGEAFWVSEGTFPNNYLYRYILDSHSLRYLGTEVLPPTFEAGIGRMKVRGRVLNEGASAVTINEVGIYGAESSSSCILLARDVLSPGVTLNPDQILQVEYSIEIAV